MAVERKGFVGTIEGRDYSEVGPTGQPRVVRRDYVIPPAARIAQFKKLVRRCLKWLVRGLYVGPLFVLAALVGSAFSPAASDLITVAFVCVLVAFFALLSPYLVLSAIEFRVGERGHARLRPPFSRSGARTLARPSPRDLVGDGGEVPPQLDRVRVRGKVVELEPRPTGSTPVVVDGWLPNSEPPSRVTEAGDFAVVNEEGQVAVIECHVAPTVIARPTSRPTAEMLDTMQEATRRAFASHGPVGGADRGDWVTLRAGDEVEVDGVVARALPNVRSFDLSGRTFGVPGGAGLGPYRGASNRSGLLLRCEGDDVVTIRKLE